MNTLTLQEIKNRGSKVLPKSGPAYIIVNSKPQSVVLPVDEYEKMIEIIEEYEDSLAYEERKDGEYEDFETFVRELKK